MTFNRIFIEYVCKNCKKTETVERTVFIPINGLIEEDTGHVLIPRGWLKLEVLDRPLSAAYNHAGSSDAFTVCSKECLIKYYQKGGEDAS